MAWRFNEEKLRQLMERASQLRAALTDVSERRQEALLERGRQQRTLDMHRRTYGDNAPVPAHLQRAHDQAEAAYQRLDAEYQKAATRSREARAIAQNLESFARKELGWPEDGSVEVRL